MELLKNVITSVSETLLTTSGRRILISALFFIIITISCNSDKDIIPKLNSNLQTVLDNIPVLTYDREDRLPIYVSRLNINQTDKRNVEKLLTELDNRGIGLVSTWRPDNRKKCLSECLPIARAQKKLGLRVNINANPLLYSLFNGDSSTAHIDKNGKLFFDKSFGSKHKMGCPFTLDPRKEDIRERVDFYSQKYKDEDIPVGFISADWEIDGPLEVNKAFEASKKCVRCSDHLGPDFTFKEFQKTMRVMRSYLQAYMFSKPILLRFPDALIGNYAMYPNDGYRYWYDFYEYYVEGRPYKPDQKAKYRKWFNDFPSTGYTCAMPVVYTWFRNYDWYDFENSDYRWFYNMLLVASNASKSTPQNIPIISFVTWNTVWVDLNQKLRNPDPAVKQMSAQSYQELLWHMLLRGTDTFWVYSGSAAEFSKEIRLVHEVYATAQQFGDFLENGIPINYGVPDKPGTVISGLILGDSVLIRRSDFGNDNGPAEILAGTKTITVESAPGKCQIIYLK